MNRRTLKYPPTNTMSEIYSLKNERCFRRLFLKCFRHWRSGKLVYPVHAEFISFLVPAKRSFCNCS